MNEENTFDGFEILEPFSCAECNKLCDSKQQIFENDHCGHRVCEMCRFFQEAKCNSCLKNDVETVGLGDMKPENSQSKKIDCFEEIMKARRKRNSLKSYQHIVPVEGVSGKYRCTVCDKEIKQQSTSYHYACIDDKKPLSCDHCEKTFVKKSHLECHLLSHLGIKPFKCTQCPKAFMQRDKLKRHDKTHSDERSFTCNTCSKSFKMKEDFNKHLLTHTEARLFKCDACPRSYKNRKNLASHKLKHTGTKDFICETCGKSFTMSWQLTAHSRRHQNKRLFKCGTCGHRFYSLVSLKRHQVTHTEICDYECSLCNTAFKRKDNLERHMKNLHEIPIPPKLRRKSFTKVSGNAKSGETADKEQKKTDKESKLNCADKLPVGNMDVENNKRSVIVVPENIRVNEEKPKSYPVSVIVGPQTSKTENHPLETPKHLPYRILPPDKRFLERVESKNCVPTIMNLKAMHIVRTSETGESNIQTIVTTDDKTGLIGQHDAKMYAIDAQAELCKKVSQGKDDKMNKCFRIINHTDSILSMKDNVLPKKSLKYRRNSYQGQSDVNSFSLFTDFPGQSGCSVVRSESELTMEATVPTNDIWNGELPQETDVHQENTINLSPRKEQ